MCNRLDESVWVNMMCTCILLAFPVIFEDYHLCKSALRGTVKYSRQYYRILWDLAEISYYKMLYSEFCSEINAAHFPSEHNTFITVLNAGNHTVIVYSSWLKTFVTRLFEILGCETDTAFILYHTRGGRYDQILSLHDMRMFISQ